MSKCLETGLVLTEFDTSLPILSYPSYTRSLHISRNPIPLSKPQLALRRMALAQGLWTRVVCRRERSPDTNHLFL